MIDLIEFAANKHGNSFVKEVKRIAKKLNINVYWLLFVMWSESRISPEIDNRGTNANGTTDYGILQWNETTLTAYNITGEQLKRLTALEQLKYVEIYYSPIIGKAKRLGDLYLWNLSPQLFLDYPNSQQAKQFKKEVETKYTATTGKSPEATHKFGFFELSTKQIITGTLLFIVLTGIYFYYQKQQET